MTLDIFDCTVEHRHECMAKCNFIALLRQVNVELSLGHLNTALELTRLPQSKRGFGHVKARNEQATAVRRSELLKKFSALQAKAVPERAVA